jgi:hypothetical protein
MSCENFGQGGTSHVLTEVVGGAAATGAAVGMVALGAAIIAADTSMGNPVAGVIFGAIPIATSVPAAKEAWSGIVDPSVSTFDGGKKVSSTESFIQKGLSGACKLVTRLTP